MDENVALRNFKDFLTIYNQMAEICFNRCVSSLNSRVLTSQEESCVDHCAAKQINVNHKMMSVYVEVQPQMTQRRTEEMQRQLESSSSNAIAETTSVNADDVAVSVPSASPLEDSAAPTATLVQGPIAA